MTTDEAAKLRAELAKTKRGPGRRYEPAAKQRALAYIRRRRREGAVYEVIGHELGLGIGTVRRWCMASARQPESKMGLRKFVPVQVVSEPKPSTTKTFSVVSPSGYRLEGLGLEDVVAAMRALR